MSPRLVLALALAPLFAAASAHAQAPGDYDKSYAGGDSGYGGGDYYAGPSATTPVAIVAPPPPQFTSRWSIAAAMGTMSLAPENNPDAKADFSVGELSLRYRGWRHLELELAFAGGNQKLENGDEGDLKIAHVTFAARYRFNPQQHWNWWLMAGLGGTTVAPKDATQEQAKMEERGHALLGIGLEYRWVKFALQAEAKAIAVGPTEAEQQYADSAGQDPQKISGGMFTLGAGYYF